MKGRIRETRATKEGSCDQKPQKTVGRKIYKPRLQNVTKEGLRSLLCHKFQRRKMANMRQDRRISIPLLSACLDMQEFNCSICLELMIHPISLQCGHSFCLRCMQNLNKTEMKYRCALCRANDSKEFYEVDKIVEKMIRCIAEYRMKDGEKQEYAIRKKVAMKEVPKRGVSGVLKVDEEVKIRINSYWESGKVVGIIRQGKNIFYKIDTIRNQCTLPHDSLNISSNEDQILKQKLKRQNTSLFSQNIFIENDVSPPPSNTYNIEELLWEVNYYPPSEAANNSYWNFEPELFNNELSDEVLMEAISESVEYYGQTVHTRLVRREPQVIEID